MSYAVTIEGFEGQNIEVNPGFWTGAKLLVNGQPAPKGKAGRDDPAAQRRHTDHRKMEAAGPGSGCAAAGGGQRKFGAMWLVQNENEVVGRLGPEPLDHAFSIDALRELLDKHDVPVKPLLCDQTIIAGIGNMYADEALFEARIHPKKRTRKLKAKECERLYNAICHVLVEAIARCGASVSTYQQPDGEPGFAHLFFQVAHRRDERCYRCETPIKRIALRGRGTYFCPKCQRA